MPWIYEKPNECVVFCFVFYMKKVCQKSYEFPYNLLRWFSQSYSQTFLVTNLYLQIFFYHAPQSYVTSIFCPTNEER